MSAHAVAGIVPHAPREELGPITFALPPAERAAREVRPRRVLLAWAFVLVLAVVAVIAGAGRGAVSISPGSVVGVLLEGIGVDVPWSFDREMAPLLWSIRFPRVALGMLVGATLATSGGALQGLFRNPLADPGVIGVSAGSMLASALAIVLGGRLLSGESALQWVPWLMPVSAFVGALVSVLVVFAVATHRGGGTSVATMLLAGIAVSALAAAGTGLLISIADDTQLRALSFWTLGSLGGATWHTVGIATLPMLVSVLALQRSARALDLLLLGEHEARHLGVDTTRVRVRVISLVALGVGSAVAFTGTIGFVGLIIPHMVRLTLGPSHRLVLPIGAVLGAALLTLTDLGARTVVAPIELPIGAVTAAVGAPVFLWLVMRRRALVIA